MVLNYNDADTTIGFVNRIRNYDCFNMILIVDNCSSDSSYERLSALRDDKVLLLKSNKNGGYGYGNNYGAKFLYDNQSSNYVLLSNPDVYFDQETILEMLRVINDDKSIGVVSAVQKDINDHIIEDVAWRIPTAIEYGLMGSRLGKYIIRKDNRDKYLEKNQCEVDCVPGACLLINNEAFQLVGGYDERMFLYCEETVLAIKLKKAGFKTLLLSNRYYKHEHSISINKSIDGLKKQKKLLYESREFVLRYYLDANPFEMLIGKIMHNHILRKLP